MKLIIGADLVPTKTNEDLFAAGDAEALIGEDLTRLLSDADYRIFNLEVPLVDTETPIKKCGPNLIAPTKTISGIKNIGVDLFTVANNHIMDQGAQGLRSTLETLKKADIAYVGAGSNIAEASKAFIKEINNKRVGIYTCVEHEFSVAGENTPGANPFDTLYCYDHVEALKKQCDYVIVLYHGGKEHYRYPSPELQRYCRRFVEKGADLVICQHSHCIGCKERYQAGTIVYGQGNFLFDSSNDSEFRQTSLLIKIDEDFDVSYIPITKSGNKVRLADREKAAEILKQFEIRSEEIKTPGFVEEQYNKFASRLNTHYMHVLGGSDLLLRVINKLTGRRMKKKLPDKKRLSMLNCIECESHRELLIRGLKNGD